MKLLTYKPNSQKYTRQDQKVRSACVLLLDLFDESLLVQVPWGKGRAPAFEVPTISHPFRRHVKANCFNFTFTRVNQSSFSLARLSTRRSQRYLDRNANLRKASTRYQAERLLL